MKAKDLMIGDYILRIFAPASEHNEDVWAWMGIIHTG